MTNLSVLSNVAVKTLYGCLTAATILFVSMLLLTSIHPQKTIVF